MMAGRKILIKIIKLTLTAVVLYYVGRQIGRYWVDIQDYSWHVNWLLMAISVIGIQLGPLLFANAWQRIIGSFGFAVSLIQAFKITYLSNLGRYVPGKVWQFVGLLYMTNRKGIPPESAGASFVLIQFFSVPAALLVYALCAQLEPAIGVDQVAILGPYSAILMTLVALTASMALVIYPRPFLAFANLILRRFGRPPVQFRLDKRVALWVMGGYSLGWIVYGLAFWLMLMAVNATDAPSPIAAIGIFCLSYQIGYLTLFAPGGFGPRELVMGALLAPYFGPVAPAIAILARLWSLVIDSLAAVAALKIKL